MKKVSIQPGCITCGLCEFLAPEVFQVTDKSYVKESAPIHLHQEAIQQAASLCPVNVIDVEEENVDE